MRKYYVKLFNEPYDIDTTRLQTFFTAYIIQIMLGNLFLQNYIFLLCILICIVSTFIVFSDTMFSEIYSKA